MRYPLLVWYPACIPTWLSSAVVHSPLVKTSGKVGYKSQTFLSSAQISKSRHNVFHSWNLKTSLWDSVEKDNIEKGQTLIHLASQTYSLQLCEGNNRLVPDDDIATPPPGMWKLIRCSFLFQKFSALLKQHPSPPLFSSGPNLTFDQFLEYRFSHINTDVNACSETGVIASLKCVYGVWKACSKRNKKKHVLQFHFLGAPEQLYRYCQHPPAIPLCKTPVKLHLQDGIVRKKFPHVYYYLLPPY